jgi:hypothetical protein
VLTAVLSEMAISPSSTSDPKSQHTVSTSISLFSLQSTSRERPNGSWKEAEEGISADDVAEDDEEGEIIKEAEVSCVKA